jgi:predicted GNAT family acetyltransferase
MSDETMLDNAIWHALASLHRPLRRGTGLAACYQAEVSRFAGLERPTDQAFADLATLTAPGEHVALFTADPPEVPAAWHVVRARPIEQMVCRRLQGDAPRIDLPLTAADVPDMLALAEATRPGPFAAGTIRMGRYLGVRSAEDGRLAAMAGERLRLTGYTEISAVCTDPAFRGRGLARRLVAALSAQLLAEGSTPFLHVKTENGAKALYESLGFRTRRIIRLTVLAAGSR